MSPCGAEGEAGRLAKVPGMAASTMPARRTSIRWDRLGRLALLGTLIVILLLYISPAKHWLQQSSTAGAQRKELQELTQENKQLKKRVHALKDPGALEREARNMGMVRQGERAYVIENLPR
jgi:cell division protein FtsB